MKIINKKHLQIDFLISKNLVTYDYAINFMEERVNYIKKKKKMKQFGFWNTLLYIQLEDLWS